MHSRTHNLSRASVPPVTGLLSVTLLALLIRAAYLYLATQSLGLEKLFRYAPDTGIYLTVAEHVRFGDPHGPYALFRVGPGYGGVLAVLQSIFGESPWVPLSANVIFGALGSLGVGLLAWELTGKRWLTCVSGLISALSHTSITLSSLALTDQPAFTAQVFTLVAFARGLRTARSGWFVLAGLLGSAALFIRPSVQFWPYLLIAVALALPRQPAFRSRTAMIGRAALTGLIMLGALYGWSLRNYMVHERFVFGTNGMLTMRSTLVAQARGFQFPDSTISVLRTVWETEDGDRVGDPVRALDNATRRVRKAVRENWRGLVLAYYQNLSENVRVANAFIERQVPALGKLGRWLNDQVVNWLGTWLIYSSALGVIALWLQRYRGAALLLGAVYLYATAMVGLSFWQGSRLHFPAEMAWAILIPAGIGSILGSLWRLVTKRT